jgi:hypothetical protein
MLFTGTILGILAWISILLTFRHIPETIKRFLLRHHFLSDILASGFTLLVLGGISQSISSIIGTVLCTVLVEITLVIHTSLKPGVVEGSANV